jgi:hypothetical protein
LINFKLKEICSIIANTLKEKNEKIYQIINETDIKGHDKYYKISIESKNDYLKNRLLSEYNEFN